MTERGTHPSELAWARHLSGEFGWLEAWKLRRHLAGCEACRAREAEHARDREAFEASVRRRQQVAELGAAAAALRPVATRRRRLVPWLAGGAAAVGAALLLQRPATAPELTAKGGDQLLLLVDGPAGAVPLGGRCAPGDRLIARYRTGQAYLLILEQDGQGSVQVLFPQDGASSARLEAPEGTTPTSWVLDATPGRECFAAFFSGAPVDVAVARSALLASAGGPALAGVTVRLQCCDKAAP